MNELQESNLKSNKITKLCLPALFCCLLWGSAFPCIKIGYRLLFIDSGDTGTQLLFAGIRFFIAGLMVIAFESVRRKSLVYPNPRSLGKIALISLFQTIIQYLFFYIGLAHTSGVRASIIVACNVFIALLISAFVFRLESFSFNKAAGCIIGFVGVAAVNLNGSSLGGFSIVGDGFILIAAFSAAMSTVLIKIFSKGDDPVMISGYQFAFGGLVLGIMGFSAGGRISGITLPAAAMILYLGFISAAAYTVWSILLKNNPVSSVTVYGFANPVFGVILSGIILGGERSGIRNVGHYRSAACKHRYSNSKQAKAIISYIRSENQMYIRNFFGHLYTITHHRHKVIYHCIRAGIPFQGLKHDLSKYSPSEFFAGVKYYQDGEKSPNQLERQMYGYSAAWLHHKGRNRHHFEYWNDYNLKTKKDGPIKMPRKYLIEMFCDRMAACKVYLKDKYHDGSALEYFLNSKRAINMHPDTARELEFLLRMLAQKGEDHTFKYIKSHKEREFDLPVE